MTYSFHPEAEAEFNGAIDYYEAREASLGYDFAVEVYAAVQRIIAYPMSWPMIHLRREPDYWKHRMT